MANVYDTDVTTITATNTYTTVFTAAASTTLVRAIRIMHDSASATATLALTKSGGSRQDMGEFSLTSKTLTNTITEVLPLSAGDVLEVKATHQPTRVWVSFVENVASIAGQSIDVLTDVDTTGKANGNVLTWDSAAAQWEAAAPAGITSVTGTAPIVSSGGTTPAISITAATTSAAGSMSAADKTKLDGITAGAAVASVTGTAPIVSSGGTSPAISITAATTSAAGSMSAADKTKLDGIAAGAQVNQSAFSNFAVATQTTVAADTTTDTVTFAQAGGMTITTNATTDTITFDSARLDDDDVTLAGNRTINTDGNDLIIENTTANKLIEIQPDAVITAGLSVRSVNGTTAGAITLFEATNNGGFGLTLTAPAQLTASTTFTLPSADGTNGQVVQTNGSGVMSFVTKKHTQVTGKTVATGAWSLVSGVYEASISDAAILSTSIVNVIPDNASASTVRTAQMLPRTDSSAGAVKIYSTNLPAATITVTLNILDL